MASHLYELLYIIDATLDEPGIQRLSNDMRGVIQQAGGEIKKESNWGARRLSYEINKKNDGIYINVEFFGSTDIPNQILQYVSTHHGILRHIVIAVPKAKLVQEKMDADRLQKQLDAAERERQEALTAAGEATATAAATKPDVPDLDDEIDTDTEIAEEEEETV